MRTLEECKKIIKLKEQGKGPTETSELLDIPIRTVMDIRKRYNSVEDIKNRPLSSFRSNYSRQDFIEAIKNNESIAGALRDLGLNPSGANYKSVHKKV